MDLRADNSEVSGRVVVSLTGSVGMATVPTLQNVLTRTIVEHPGEQITVDLDAVDGIDDVGLGILLGAAGRARRGGGDLVIVSSDKELRDRFTVTGLDRAITIARSLAG